MTMVNEKRETIETKEREKRLHLKKQILVSMIECCDMFIQLPAHFVLLLISAIKKSSTF